ncbi:hypothetical protein J6590_076369 [Homalodisca vitripennis]|nr:hypothetical protein J6590_076369 [Homalodisca vitripennis]
MDSVEETKFPEPPVPLIESLQEVISDNVHIMTPYTILDRQCTGCARNRLERAESTTFHCLRQQTHLCPARRCLTVELEKSIKADK